MRPADPTANARHGRKLPRDGARRPVVCFRLAFQSRPLLTIEALQHAASTKCYDTVRLSDRLFPTNGDQKTKALRQIHVHLVNMPSDH